MQLFANAEIKGGILSKHIKGNGGSGIRGGSGKTFRQLKGGIIAQFKQVRDHERRCRITHNLIPNLLQNSAQFLLLLLLFVPRFFIHQRLQLLPFLPRPFVTSAQIADQRPPILRLGRHCVQALARWRECQSRREQFGNVTHLHAPRRLGRAVNVVVVQGEMDAGGGPIGGCIAEGDEEDAAEQEHLLAAKFGQRVRRRSGAGGRGGGGGSFDLLLWSRFHGHILGRWRRGGFFGHLVVHLHWLRVASGWRLVHLHARRSILSARSTLGGSGGIGRGLLFLQCGQSCHALGSHFLLADGGFVVVIVVVASFAVVIVRIIG
mmetsp:Transcript_39581/g.83198  ORF Transcript_39581/g.83198 Transcript_39581/m.83198 type:complete len:320 (+) Transcript_39581:2528-3487(+)